MKKEFKKSKRKPTSKKGYSQKQPSSKKPKKFSQNIEGSIMITSKGVGYVRSEALEEDIEIYENSLNTALHGDKVQVFIHPIKKDRRPNGEVTKIIERKKTEFVGTLETKDGITFLVPDDKKIYKDIIISKDEQLTKIKDDDKVLIKLKPWVDSKKNPRGEIIKVLGKKGDNNVEMEAIILERGFDATFPKEIEKEAHRIKEGAEKDFAEEVKKRKDIRGATTLTIDPFDAKDFDDALSIKYLEDGNLEIGIHIADVSHFVKIGTSIDKEAVKRGTSIYLVDRTIPMLPEVLSNNLCSLNPNEDKLAFSVIITMTPEGKVTDRWFGETVINSDKRFSYQEAQDILDKKEGAFYKELKQLDSIAKKLKQERLKKGSIAFGSEEVKFELDINGKPIAVKTKVLLDTNALVEDFMLLANKEVAEYIFNVNKDIKTPEDLKPFVYRIHDMPNKDRINELSVYLKTIGHQIKITEGQISSRDINNLLQQIRGKAEEGLIRKAVLKSMSKAIYSTQNIGHYGLAFKHYTHFTSPIRRYPDVMVHRILKKYLSGKTLSEGEIRKHQKLAIHSSQQEIVAVDAERASIKYKYVEFMSNKIGEEFDGIITGITNWGIYVEDTKTKAEGLVSLRTLKDDFYTLDTKNYRIVGERTKKKYSLGDKLKIRLTKTDLENKTMDFEVV
ncbi:ribonuclease R [Patescibacteria group bacterium]